jgi:glycosyltransferase involved in cell wall biosynthesis
MKRNLLFLNYWSLHEPLTHSTVLPTLRMLLADGLAQRVVLVTVERGVKAIHTPADVGAGILHVPLVAGTQRPRALSRAWDILRMVPRLADLVDHERIDLVMARGVIAGGFAHFVHRRTGVPYAVDYFEPHNDYMTDVGEWKKGGLLDRGTGWLIRQQLRTAQRCVTVSQNYRQRLISAGTAPSKLLVAPCPVDAGRMRFDPASRATVRQARGWEAAVIGIYAGKFGGLYHREHAFRAFTTAQAHIGAGFALIILTPHPEAEVREGLSRAGFQGDRFLITYAQHHEVPAYLSSADLAFAPYCGTPSSACISPMKIGEYWANGLPVLLTRGVGDDSAIIGGEPFAGALFDPEGEDLAEALVHVQRLICEPGQRTRTALLAATYRSMDLTRQAYRSILS